MEMLVKTYLDTLISLDKAAINAIVKDCKAVFNCRSLKSSTDDYSEGCTYFIKASESSRCSLEHIALSIFQHHTSGMADIDASNSGAEWWTQVIDSRDDIGFHWDRDYGVEEETGQHIYPDFGTVTYLSDNGGPTVVMNKIGGDDDTHDITGDIDEFIASKPMFGKHLLFGGNLLHAAPSSLIEDEDEEDDGESDDDESGSEDDPNCVFRVTLLVNVWVNHVPIQSIRFPDAQIGELSTNLLSKPVNGCLKFTKAQSEPQTTIKLDAVNCSRTMLWKFSNSDVKYIVSCPLPEASSVAASFDKHHLIAYKYSTEDVQVNITVDESEDSDDEEGDGSEGEEGAETSEDDNDDDDNDDNGSSGSSSDESMPESPAKKSRRL